MIEDYLKQQTEDILRMLKDNGIKYLDICFIEDSIMITDADNLKINSLDGGETWQKR